MTINSYSMSDYREELDYIENTPSMSDVIAAEIAADIAVEVANKAIEDAYEAAENALRSAENTFEQMLELMDSEPSFENLVGVMGAYNMVSDISKEVYGFRMRPTIVFNNPIAVAINECANRIPWERWAMYSYEVNRKHTM